MTESTQVVYSKVKLNNINKTKQIKHNTQAKIYTDIYSSYFSP